MRWTTKLSCDVNLCQEFWCQKLLKSDNYSSTYRQQYEWMFFFWNTVYIRYSTHTVSSAHTFYTVSKLLTAHQHRQWYPMHIGPKIHSISAGRLRPWRSKPLEVKMPLMRHIRHYSARIWRIFEPWSSCLRLPSQTTRCRVPHRHNEPNPDDRWSPDTHTDNIFNVARH